VPQLTLDLEGRITAINPAACLLGGWSSDREVLGRLVTWFLEPSEREEAERRLAPVLRGEIDRTQRLRRIRRADGNYVDATVIVSAVRDADGTVSRIEGVVQDVSSDLAVHRALEATEEKWQLLAVHSADVALLCDEAGLIRFVSAAVGRQFGYDPGALVGADRFSCFHPDDEPHARTTWAEATDSPGLPVSLEARVIDGNGKWRWVEQVITSRLDIPGVESVVVNIINIDSLKHAEQQLQEISGHDPLTGSATRERLLDELAIVLTDAARATGVAVAILDLDRFSLINAGLGQDAGDVVLIGVARRLQAAAFEGEVVARLGGDRFALLLTDADNAAALRVRVGELLRVVADAQEIEDACVTVTASAGVAFGQACGPSDLLQSAEAALREAKSDIHDPVRIVRAGSPSMAIARAVLIEELKRALLANELVVHFQPVLSLTDGRVAAAEALVRWHHPERGLLGPSEFIDAAEASGLIVDVGRVVLRQACVAAARWGNLGNQSDPFHVAVNLSAKQLMAAGAVELVQESLAAAGADPRNLMLEVTESAVMADVEVASATLQQLRDLGVAVAVDDFGTGYSSLTYVKRFPVTALKVDRSFVAGLGTDEDDAAIVASVISLARAVRMDCIAEGVETHGQRLALQALGCGYAQGFLWAPALDPVQFDAWARDHQPAEVLRTAPVTAENGQRTSRDEQARGAAAPALLARIAALQSQGASLHSIAAALNAEQTLTARGKRWHPRSVAKLIAGHRAT
jgi:diguanylate cyclase (GGDEF)-like protein/PAS domain S-box-containing protein